MPRIADPAISRRREKVAALRADGLTAKAIARLLKASKDTVEKDIQTLRRQGYDFIQPHRDLGAYTLANATSTNAATTWEAKTNRPVRSTGAIESLIADFQARENELAVQIAAAEQERAAVTAARKALQG